MAVLQVRFLRSEDGKQIGFSQSAVLGHLKMDRKQFYVGSAKCSGVQV